MKSTAARWIYVGWVAIVLFFRN